MCGICDSNCNGLCKLIKCGVTSDGATIANETILTLLFSLAIDLGLEFGWSAEDSTAMQGWLKEALVSSGATAACAALISGTLWTLRYNYEPKGNPFYYHTRNILSQLFSSAFSFTIGMGVECTLEAAIGHGALDGMKQQERIWASLAVPCLITAAKTLARYGFFKAATAVIDKCCSQSQTYTSVPLMGLPGV